MKQYGSTFLVVFAAILGLAKPVLAQEARLGASLESLIDYARRANPDYAAMRADVDATSERLVPAGALPDPRFRTELRDITRQGDQGPLLLPGQVGSTRYLLMQDLPWSGKRDLKRDIAAQEVEVARGRAAAIWSEIAARIKTSHARLYYLHGSARLTQEILDLMARLENITQARYAGGLAAQQDVIRAQVEQSALRNELIALEAERRQQQAKLNALLARPANGALAEPAGLRALPAPAKLAPDTLEARIRARNPQLLVEESRVRAAQKNRELVYKNRYPDFTLGISPIQYQNSLKEWELMVELNIPLQQSARRAQERESEAMLQAAMARKEAASNQVLADLSELLAGIEAARRTENLVTTQLLPQSELTYQAALAGYETGKVDFATLLDAQRQIRQARQGRLKAQAEAQMRLAEIEQLVGEDL